MDRKIVGWSLLVVCLAACSGSTDGTTSGTSGRVINPNAPVISSFTASPTVLSAAGSATLSWSVSQATSLSIDNGIGVVTGSSTTVPITKSTNFRLTATNSSGTVTRSVQVTLDLRPPPPVIDTFTATPTTLPFGGGTVTLNWTASNATSLSIDNGVGVVTGSSTAVPITATTTFTLTATNAWRTAKATATVTVDAQQGSAPTIQSFTATPSSLPSTGGTVTLAWATTDATSLSIDQSVGTVTGTSTTVPVTATTTFTLTATNATGHVTAPASVTVAVDVDRYADAVNGSDTNDCSFAAPCLTIAAALAVAPAGSTVRLFDGTYGTTTQGSGGITIPDGIGLSAIHPGAAILANRQMLATGSTALTDLVFGLEGVSGSTFTAESTTGNPTLTLTGNLIECMDAFTISGNVQATMTPGTLSGGLYTSALPNSYGGIIHVQGNATLLIQGGVFDGNDLGAPAFGGGLISVLNNSQLTLDGVTLQNRTEVGLLADNTASITVRNNSVFNNVGTAGGDCPTGAAIVLSGTNTLSIDHTQMTGLGDGAVCVRSTLNVATISITNSTIDHSAYGVICEIGNGSVAVVTIDATTISSNGYGINFAGLPGTTFSVTNCTLDANQNGVEFAGVIGATFTMRNSSVTNGTTAGILSYSGVTLDLGTTADPGGNTITGNVGGNLTSNLDVGNTTATAVGNTWDVGQGSDANGHYSVPPGYAAVVEQGPANGKNYNIANATPLSL